MNLASTDKFEAIILSAHIRMVNKKKPHPLVFVGGIKDKVSKAISNELFYATEIKNQTGNDNLGYYIFSFVLWYHPDSKIKHLS